jgi:GTP-binding protein
MPGYGFAQAPKDKVATWTRLIHSYLTGRPNLRRVYVLVDGRHGPKANDKTVMNELDKAAVSYQVVVTKADKPSHRSHKGKFGTLQARPRACRGKTREAIAKRPAAHPELILTSSETKFGMEGLRAGDRRDSSDHRPPAAVAFR